MHNLFPVLWSVLILALGPIAGIAGRRKLRAAAPQRNIIYLGNAANLIVFGSITAVIDFYHRRTALGLMTLSRTPRAVLIWSVCLAAACITLVAALLVARAWLRRPPNASIIRLLPRSRGEKIGFVSLCVLIALVEEFIYRGFVLTLLRDWLASDIMAVGLVSISFALMHGLQDLVAITSAFIQSILLSLPVLILHSLIPSIVAHFAVDVFAGLCMLTLLRRLGAPTESKEQGAAIAKT